MLDKGDFQEEDEAGAKHPAKYVAREPRWKILSSRQKHSWTHRAFDSPRSDFQRYSLVCQSSLNLHVDLVPVLSRLTSALCRACVVSPPSVSERTHCTSLASRHLLEDVGAIHLRRNLCDPGDGAEEDADPLGRQRDLGIIQLGAFFLWRDNHHRLAEIKAAQFEKSVPGYLGMVCIGFGQHVRLETDYASLCIELMIAWYPRRRDGILAQFSWWNDHMWSSEQTWKGVLVVLFNTTATQIADRDIGKYLQGKDWDKTATFFANSIHSPDGMRNKVSTIDLKYCKFHAV